MADLTYDARIDVLDLPQIQEKPTFEQIVSAMESLKIKPPSWNFRVVHLESKPDRKKTAGYIVKFIASDLEWLTDENRDKVYEIAAARLAERSGRSALPAMTRDWVIPATVNRGEIVFTIHEPALVEDDLGLKTWGSAFVLAKRLEDIAAKHIKWTQGEERQVLELGSGTGLLGLAAAALWSATVTLTDLPQIMYNLEENGVRNVNTVMSRGGAIKVETLDWTLCYYSQVSDKFKVIIAADPVYSEEMICPFAETVGYYLLKHDDSRVIVIMPLRDSATVQWSSDLWMYFRKLNLEVIEEGMATGHDDWEDESGETSEIRCRWGVFRGMTDAEIAREEQVGAELDKEVEQRADTFGVPDMMRQLHDEEADAQLQSLFGNVSLANSIQPQVPTGTGTSGVVADEDQDAGELLADAQSSGSRTESEASEPSEMFEVTDTPPTPEKS